MVDPAAGLAASAVLVIVRLGHWTMVVAEAVSEDATLFADSVAVLA
jgi:hypothetical protein